MNPQALPKPHLLVLVSGKQGSGKTTLADALALRAADYGYRPVRTRFAAGLYKIHDAARAAAVELGIPWPPKYGKFLQLMGTELGRDVFGKDVWVQAAQTLVERELRDAVVPRVFILDDTRFPNEAALRVAGTEARTIRLSAPADVRRARADGWRDTEDHESETALDEYGALFGQVLETAALDRDAVLANALLYVFGGDSRAP